MARGRITPVDVAKVGVAIFIVGILAQPIYATMNANVGSLGTGDAYLLRMVLPAAIIGMMVLLMATAVGE